MGELWVVHVVGKGNARPELETYSYEMAGEESVTQEEIIVYDLASKSQVTVSHEPWKDEDLRITTQRQFDYPDSDEPDRSLWISDDSEELHFVRLSRDRHRAAIMVADAGTGDARMLFVDSLNTYIETRPVEMLDNGDMLWWSERDGWAHLYLYGPDGEVKQRLTEGPWHVDGIVGVDQARGFVFFTGQGREEGEDPYYAHLYRVSLNGTGLTLLNPGGLRFPVRNGRVEPILRQQLLARGHGSRVRALRRHRPPHHGPGRGRLQRPGGRRIPVPRNVSGGSRRRRDRHLRRDVQALRLRSLEDVSHCGVRLSGTTDRVGVEVVVGQPVRTGARTVRHDRGDHGEPGWTSGPLKVVPQLWIWRLARLWTGGQEGGH